MREAAIIVAAHILIILTATAIAANLGDIWDLVTWRYVDWASWAVPV